VAVAIDRSGSVDDHSAVDSHPPGGSPLPAALVLSPDGRYRWDGYQWVPTWTAPPPTVRGRRWKVLVSLGVIAAVVLVGVAIAIGAKDIANSPLANFPVYPGGSSTGVQFYTGTNGSSDSQSWSIPTDVTTVEGYYSTHLDQAPWSISGEDSASATWTFQKAGSAGTGTITFLAQGSSTDVQVTFRS
jgi:hypothetical protein